MRVFFFLKPFSYFQKQLFQFFIPYLLLYNPGRSECSYILTVLFLLMKVTVDKADLL